MMYTIQFRPLDTLSHTNWQVIELLDFPDYPLLVLAKDQDGTLYLSYLAVYLPEGLMVRHAIAISAERLAEVRAGKLKLREAFDTAEKGVVQITLEDEKSGQIKHQYQISDPAFYATINPIPFQYSI